MRLHLLIPFVTALFILTGCTSAPKRLGNPQMPYPPAKAPEVGDILHMPTGVMVEEDDMLNIATDSRIAFVGETHDNPASHRLELTVLEAMAERYPGQVALGMEMFTPEQNDVLQKWVDGELSEKEFLKQVGWYKVWKGDYDLYRGLLDFAREEQIPVIGLNAKKETVRLVVENELDEIPEPKRAAIPEMDLTDPYQRGLVEGIYGGHVKSEGMLGGFHRAQTLWDETMAESLVNFLRLEQYRDYRMVVVAGGNHVRYGFGIPRRVFRRMPVSYTLIGGKEIEIPESRQENLMDVTLPKFPMPPYDFMVFLRYEELQKEDVKLGVMLSDETGEVVVENVIPGSNAERAGIQEKDVVIAIDDEPIKENFDIIYAVSQKKAGETVILDIRRSDENIRKEFELKRTSHH